MKITAGRTPGAACLVCLALVVLAFGVAVVSGRQGQGRGQRGAAEPNPGRGGAPQNFDNENVHVLPVQGGVYMLVGGGGNVTVQIGKDGVLLVDTSVAQ